MLDPQYYIDQWSMMNKEMAEEGTPLIINIPTIENITQWLNGALPNQTTEESRELSITEGSSKNPEESRQA